MVGQQSIKILVDNLVFIQNYYTAQERLRDKLGMHKSVRNTKWLSLEYRNVTIVLEFVGIQLYSIQEHGGGDTHCLRVQKCDRDGVKGVKVDEIKQNKIGKNKRKIGVSPYTYSVY